MQVKSIAECSKGGSILREHSAILLTFIKLPFVINIFVLSIFEWPYYTVFFIFFIVVCTMNSQLHQKPICCKQKPCPALDIKLKLKFKLGGSKQNSPRSLIRDDFAFFSETCVKLPLNWFHLMQVKSIAECSKGSILQYF